MYICVSVNIIYLVQYIVYNAFKVARDAQVDVISVEK